MNKTRTGQPIKAPVPTPTTFEHEIFGSIRMIHLSDKPWFVATDVCKALGYKSTSDAVATHVEPECKCSFSLGLRGSAPLIINEEGLYSLILGSHRPEAKAFKRWVLGTVLPSIRQDGLYIKGEEKLLTSATVEELQARLADLQKKVEHGLEVKATRAGLCLQEEKEARREAFSLLSKRNQRPYQRGRVSRSAIKAKA
jgi:prophage antirepressor-like protein